MFSSGILPLAVMAVGAIILLAIFFHYVPFFLWLSAKVSGVSISLIQLFPDAHPQRAAAHHRAGHDRSAQGRAEQHHPRRT